MVSRFWKYMKNKIYFSHNILRFAHQKWQAEKGKKINIFRSLARSGQRFSTKSEEQEVNLVWPNLFLIFYCPSSVYTAHDHDLFRTLSKWISVDIKFVSFWRGFFSISRRWTLAASSICLSSSSVYSGWSHPIVVEIYITWGASHFPYMSSTYLSYN
jgi:hypothetical protein